jgi:hypothetical protein
VFLLQTFSCFGGVLVIDARPKAIAMSLRRQRDPVAETINSILGAINNHNAMQCMQIHSQILLQSDDIHPPRLTKLLSSEFGTLGAPILRDLITQHKSQNTHLSHAILDQCRTIFLTQTANSNLPELVSAMVIQFTSNFVEVVLLATANEHKRRGYGRLMVCLAAEVAKGVGNPRLVIDGTNTSQGFWGKKNLVGSVSLLQAVLS